MSGQSANLSISEAKAMIKRTEASCAKPGEHQGSKSGSKEVMIKQPHQGK
jgi:hypothetical protein